MEDQDSNDGHHRTVEDGIATSDSLLGAGSDRSSSEANDTRSIEHVKRHIATTARQLEVLVGRAKEWHAAFETDASTLDVPLLPCSTNSSAGRLLERTPPLDQKVHGNAVACRNKYMALDFCHDDDMSAPIIRHAEGDMAATQLLGHSESNVSRTSMSLQTRLKRVGVMRSLGIIATVVSLLALTSDIAFHRHSTHEKQRSHEESKHSRIDHLQRCATLLSGSTQSVDSPVVAWFLTGEGRAMEIPDTDAKCGWETNFGVLYSLVKTRQALNVRDVSWHGTPLIRKASDVCNWKRIQCNGDEVVTGLFLGHANLTGTIPIEMMGLLHLESLQLFSNNDLQGTFPTEIGHLKALKNLEIHFTAVGGSIPSDLGLSTSLEILLLNESELTGEMPNEVCRLAEDRNLKQLQATCQRVHCPCCTSCK